MADATYQPGIYRRQGGNELVIAAPGQITVESGGLLSIGAGGLIEDATGAVLRYVDTVVSSAELLALFATPKTVVPAPGAGFATIFEGALFTKPAGTAYAGIAAGENLSIKYTDASGLEVGECEPDGFLDQTTAQFRYMRPHTTATGVSSVVAVANAALILMLLLAEITTGDSPLNVRVFYRVVPTVL
jgi:hypothetical protein